VWGNTLKSFTISLSLDLFTHVVLLEKDACGLFSLLDGYFMQLGFEWTRYLEEVIDLLQILSLANVKGFNFYVVASFFVLLKP
jgi:hypothetical protein